MNLQISEISKEEIELKKSRDKSSILRLAGVFKVTFDFAETFATEKNYQREDLYHNEAIEYIFPILEEEDKISLQHILVINEKFVVKHWRQDWIFENVDFLLFEKDGIWHKSTLPKEQVVGTWTQKVYQVDDTPRYQGYGTWVYVDGKSYWESTAYAPLPRRQEHRTDYNVLIRNSRIDLHEQGWFMDQNNQKVFRDNSGNDRLIVWEKGAENQIIGNYNVDAAIKYWDDYQLYWSAIRNFWDDVITQMEIVKIKEKIGGKHLYDWIFELAKKYPNEHFHKETLRKEFFEIINPFIAK